MPKNRSRNEIVLAITETIAGNNGAIIPTRLMYGSNMSHTQLAGYLKELTAQGIVKEELVDKKRRIVLTDKGYKYLLQLKALKEFEKTFGTE